MNEFFLLSAGSREVRTRVATHCRLPDTHVYCENRTSRPGRVVLFLLPVPPSLPEGALRRIQGPLATFLLHSGISGSGWAVASRDTQPALLKISSNSLKVTTPQMNERVYEWTWVTLPWLYNLCYFPSCRTWQILLSFSSCYICTSSLCAFILDGSFVLRKGTKILTTYLKRHFVNVFIKLFQYPKAPRHGDIYRGSGSKLSHILAAALDGDEWSDIHLGWFTPRKILRHPTG
jgi:hypothetical protein